MKKKLDELTCEACGKKCKGLAGLMAHKRLNHKDMGAATTCPPVAAPGEGTQIVPSQVTFRSPRASDLRIVLKPSYWVKTETPAGIVQQLSEGKVAQFRMGVFATDDPEIIDFLENRYKDDRYPIFSLAKIREMGRGL